MAGGVQGGVGSGRCMTHLTPTTTRTPPSRNHFLAMASDDEGIVALKKHF